MRIEIWSDVVCPWCYIGKRRLETALTALGRAHPEAAPGGPEAPEVVWRAFQLEPGTPTTPTGPLAEHLGRKYGGGPDAGQQMIDRMEAAAAEEGLIYRLGQAQRVGTMDAHRLLHAALEVSPAVQGELKERLLAAYMVEGRNVADHDELVADAVAAGMDEAAAREVLVSGAHADAVEADLAQGAAYGIGGVPFTVVEGRYGISGAQPAEVFTQALERAWADAHPEPTPALVGLGGTDADGAVCGPDGCAP